VKRLTNIICFFLLIFTVMSLFLSSLAIADDPKNDLISAIDLKATGIMVKKTHAENGMANEGSLSREFSIPVSDGLSTYIDCSAPSRQDHSTKETTKDFRTVFGFHFALK
jgi:hypothetical protein